MVSRLFLCTSGSLNWAHLGRTRMLDAGRGSLRVGPALGLHMDNQLHASPLTATPLGFGFYVIFPRLLYTSAGIGASFLFMAGEHSLAWIGQFCLLIGQIFGMFPYFDCCEWCCCEHPCKNFCLNTCFQFF